MANTSTSAIAAGTTTNSIDVASIVDSLMKSETTRFDQAAKKITQQELVVSNLASVKSKVSVLQTALNTFEDKSSYSTVSASSSNSSQITASAASSASLGRYDVEVVETAESTKINIGGINALNGLSNATVNATNFQITVAGTTYTYAAGGPQTLLSSLSNYINSLGAPVNASIVAKDSTNWNLSIQGTKTGVSNKISVQNLNNGSVTDNGDGTGSTLWSNGIIETFGARGITYSTGITSSNNLAFNSAVNSSSPTVLLSQNGVLSPVGTYSISSPSSSGLTITNDTTGLTQTIQVPTPNLNSTNELDFNEFGIKVRYTTSATAGDTAAQIISDLTGKKVTISKPDITGTNLSFDLNSVAKNALVKVNGVSYLRTSNTINDIVANVTMNIVGNTKSTQNSLKTTIIISQGTDNTSTILQNLSSAYNDVVNLYNSLIKNPTSTSKGGDLFAEKSLLSYISSIKQKFSQGFYINNTSKSFSEIGITLNGDGTTKFNAIKFALASSNGLQATFASSTSGPLVGYTSSTDNLKVDLVNVLKSQGLIDTQTANKKTYVNELSAKNANLALRLESIRQKYTRQYSDLNTLLFNLNNTSKSLASSLTALTNMNAGN